MKLLSVIPGTVAASLKAPRPLQRQDTDVVMPAPKAYLECGVLLAVPDASAELVLGRYGTAGVIQVPDDVSEETMPALLAKARQVRLKHLQKLLDIYRMEQGARQLSGREMLQPTDAVRMALRESKQLKTELADDPETKELLGNLPKEQEIQQMAVAEVDAEMSGLAEYGLNPKASPLMPGAEAWGGSLPY